MKAVPSMRRAGFVIVACSLFVPPLSQANVSDAVWHCSRATDSVQVNRNVPVEDAFLLASTGLRMDAIGISIMDLIDAYSGSPVSVDGRNLTACFMPGETPLSSRALKSLGLNSSSMQQLARKSAIVQSQLQLVTDEAGMQSCISKRHPAVGYLSRVVEDDRIAPCF